VVQTQKRKQNVTLSLSLETIQKAKVLAAKRSLSISSLLAEQLDALVGAEDAYENAYRSAIDLMGQGFHLGGGPMLSRDDLHAR
jgi:hypothetical protein